jgi:hypothetical protein
MNYRKRLTPPSVEKVREILEGLNHLRREGLLILTNISFDEKVIYQLEMKNENRSRTRQMLLIREAAMQLATNHPNDISGYEKIHRRERPCPGKFLNTARVFKLFLENESLIEEPLKTYLANPIGDNEKNKSAQQKLFELGFSIDELSLLGIEKGMTHFVGKTYHAEPLNNPAEGLIGLSHKMNSSVCSILESSIYRQAKTEKARDVFEAAYELYELVSRYHQNRLKAA